MLDLPLSATYLSGKSAGHSEIIMSTGLTDNFVFTQLGLFYLTIMVFVPILEED